MKRLRNIFVIIAVLTAFSVNAQSGSGGAPVIGFQSTSTLTGSGSGVASAVTTGGVFESSMSTGKPLTHKISVRRNDDEDGDGFEDEGDEPGTGLPGEPAPIGDGVLAMIIMAAGYCLFRKKVKKICTIEK